MDTEIHKVNLVFNRILRVLEGKFDDNPSQISAQIDSLFQDENCHCICLRPQMVDKIFPIDEIDRKPSSLIRLKNESSNLIYVIGESPFFPHDNPTMKLSEKEFASFLDNLNCDSVVLRCEALGLIASLLPDVKPTVISSILRSIYSNPSPSYHYLWERFQQFMSLSPFCRLQTLLHLFSCNLSFKEFRCLIRLYLWLNSITYETGVIHSINILDSFADTLSHHLFDDCLVTIDSDCLDGNTCCNWLYAHGTQFTDYPDTLIPLELSYHIQLSRILPLLYVSLNHSTLPFPKLIDKLKVLMKSHTTLSKEYLACFFFSHLQVDYSSNEFMFTQSFLSLLQRLWGDNVSSRELFVFIVLIYLFYFPQNDIEVIMKDVYEAMKPLSINDVTLFLKCAMFFSSSMSLSLPFSVEAIDVVDYQEAVDSVLTSVCSFCSLKENTISRTSLTSLAFVIYDCVMNTTSFDRLMNSLKNTCSRTYNHSMENCRVSMFKEVPSIWSLCFTGDAPSSLSSSLEWLYSPTSLIGSSCLIALQKLAVFLEIEQVSLASLKEWYSKSTKIHLYYSDYTEAINHLFKKTPLSDVARKSLFLFFLQNGTVTVSTAELYLFLMELLLTISPEENTMNLIVEGFSTQKKSFSLFLHGVFLQLQMRLISHVLPGLIDNLGISMDTINSRVHMIMNSKTVDVDAPQLASRSYKEVFADPAIQSNPDLMRMVVESWFMNEYLLMDGIVLSSPSPFEKRIMSLRECLGLTSVTTKQIMKILHHYNGDKRFLSVGELLDFWNQHFPISPSSSYLQTRTLTLTSLFSLFVLPSQSQITDLVGIGLFACLLVVTDYEDLWNDLYALEFPHEGSFYECVLIVLEDILKSSLFMKTNHIRIPIAYYSCLLQSLLEEFSSAQGILYQSDFNHLVLKNALLFLPVSYSLLNDPIKIEDELTRQSIFTFVKNNKEALMESFKRVVKRCESNPQRVVFFGDIVSEMILPFSENKNDCDRMWMLLQSIWKVSVTNRNDEDFCYPYTFYRYLVSLLVNDVDLFKQYSRIITTSDDDVWGSDEVYQYLLSMYTMYNEIFCFTESEGTLQILAEKRTSDCFLFNNAEYYSHLTDEDFLVYLSTPFFHFNGNLRFTSSHKSALSQSALFDSVGETNVKPLFAIPQLPNMEALAGSDDKIQETKSDSVAFPPIPKTVPIIELRSSAVEPGNPAPQEVIPVQPIVKPENTVQPTASVVQPGPPVVEPTASVVQPTPPVVQPTAPVVQPGPPVVQPTAPVVQPTPPVVEPTASIVQPAPPVVQAIPIVAQPAPPVVQAIPIVVQPIQSLAQPIQSPKPSQPVPTVIQPAPPVVQLTPPVVQAIQSPKPSQPVPAVQPVPPVLQTVQPSQPTISVVQPIHPNPPVVQTNETIEPAPTVVQTKESIESDNSSNLVPPVVHTFLSPQVPQVPQPVSSVAQTILSPQAPQSPLPQSNAETIFSPQPPQPVPQPIHLGYSYSSQGESSLVPSMQPSHSSQREVPLAELIQPVSSPQPLQQITTPQHFPMAIPEVIPEAIPQVIPEAIPLRKEDFPSVPLPMEMTPSVAITDPSTIPFAFPVPPVDAIPVPDQKEPSPVVRIPLSSLRDIPDEMNLRKEELLRNAVNASNQLNITLSDLQQPNNSPEILHITYFIQRFVSSRNVASLRMTLEEMVTREAFINHGKEVLNNDEEFLQCLYDMFSPQGDPMNSKILNSLLCLFQPTTFVESLTMALNELCTENDLVDILLLQSFLQSLATCVQELVETVSFDKKTLFPETSINSLLLKPLTVITVNEFILESLLEIENKVLVSNPDPIHNYIKLRRAIGIVTVNLDDWQRIVLNKASYDKLPSIQHPTQITLPLFRQVLYSWMELCGIAFPPQLLHILITRLFRYLKNSEGYVDVFDIVAAVANLFPMQAEYTDQQLYAFCLAILTMIEQITSVDLKSIPRNVIEIILQKTVSIKLFFGKQPLDKKDVYNEVVKRVLADCSESMNLNDIIGIVYALKNSSSEEDKELFSFIFVDIDIFSV